MRRTLTLVLDRSASTGRSERKEVRAWQLLPSKEEMDSLHSQVNDVRRDSANVHTAAPSSCICFTMHSCASAAVLYFVVGCVHLQQCEKVGSCPTTL